jgi:hypothetical protein
MMTDAFIFICGLLTGICLVPAIRNVYLFIAELMKLHKIEGGKR